MAITSPPVELRTLIFAKILFLLIKQHIDEKKLAFHSKRPQIYVGGDYVPEVEIMNTFMC